MRSSGTRDPACSTQGAGAYPAVIPRTNEFFYLDRATAAKWDIEAEFLRPILNRRAIAPAERLSGGAPAPAFVVHRGKPRLLDERAALLVWGESRVFTRAPLCAWRATADDIGERPDAHLAWIKGVWNRHFAGSCLQSGIALDQQVYAWNCSNPRCARSSPRC